MAKAVSDVSDEVEVFAFLASEQTVNGIDDYFDNVNILPLIEATDVVGFGYFALMEDEVDGTGMVFYKEPVAYILAFAIDRQWLAVADVVDEEGYQLLRKLIRPVVIGAVSHDGRHTVGVMVGTDEMVAARFARRIG